MSREKDPSIKKRLIFSILFLTLVFSFLIYKLYIIQITQSEEFIKEAIIQRSVEFPIYPKRGIIFDRNLLPITNNQLESTIIVEKNKLLSDKNLLNNVLYATNLRKDEIDNIIKSSKNLIQLTVLNKKPIEDSEEIFLVDIIKRYDKNNPLAHVIGYINKSDNKGSSGIEFVHDEFLKNYDKKSYFIEYDRDRKIILGSSEYEESIKKSGEPNSVQLTIDLNLQKYIEELLDKFKYNGSVIVSEVSSGDLLSMVSRPNFDQDNIEKHLSTKDMSLYNKAIQVRYPPGSVFKIVVLLAALEDDINNINSLFYCNGYEIVNGLSINCTASHGQLTLKEAFAKSCNSSFIQLGKKVGAVKVIEMAEKLGLDSKTNIGLVEEINGLLPKKSQMHGAAIGNISIGQGIIELTPMQITNLMMTICNRGIEKDISIIKAITNQNGRIIKKYEKDLDKRIIEEEISDLTLDLLREVANSGTARSINLDEIGGAGGKTGSAQAVLDGNDTVHGWFTGFYPSEEPKYVITILIENSNTGSKVTLPIFENIVKGIEEINN